MIYGEIVGVEQTSDAQKNIVIWVCFTQDGEEISFYRGTELLERGGKKVWPLYARYENFLGKSPAMIQEWIRVNVESQIGNIIQEIICKETLNAEMIGAIGEIVGTQFSSDKVSIPVDTMCTGKDNAIVELKADKTYTVK